MAKRILITGGAVGIGEATSRQLAPGNRLIVHYNASAAEASSLIKELEPVAAEVHAIQANLATDQGCVLLRDAVQSRFGALDVLVNNAGGMIERCAVKDLPWDHLLATFELNVFSTMRLTALCTDLLQRGDDSCVVNVTSISIRHGAPTATAYGAAKAAIDAFTRGAARELAPVRVNAVAPGIIDTRFHERLTPPDKMRSFIEATPLKRIGTPETVAKAIQFIIDSDFMTGETVDCNGGLFMR
ncbi:MAG TPA: SDR family oxidoreductase [Bryobacteraceae bacterium]